MMPVDLTYIILQLLGQFKVDIREFSIASDDKNKFKNRVTNALPCKRSS